jgi:hypothetical protein
MSHMPQHAFQRDANRFTLDTCFVRRKATKIRLHCGVVYHKFSLYTSRKLDKNVNGKGKERYFIDNFQWLVARHLIHLG